MTEKKCSTALQLILSARQLKCIAHWETNLICIYGMFRIFSNFALIVGARSKLKCLSQLFTKAFV